MAQLYTFYPYN